MSTAAPAGEPLVLLPGIVLLPDGTHPSPALALQAVVVAHSGAALVRVLTAPKVRSKSPNPLTIVASSSGPRGARPMNAAIDVATPVMVRTPLGISSM